MTQPLKYARGMDIPEGTLQQMTVEEFSLFRYNLRVRYANDVFIGGTGAIALGATPSFPYSNTLRTQVTTGPAPSAYPGASTGVVTQTFNYGQNLTGAPATPSDFTFSYAQFTNDDFIQERDVNRIIDFIVNPCIAEMRNADGMFTGNNDEVGTYRVSITSPGTGWSDMGVFFTDSAYLHTPGINQKLWLRMTATAPSTSLPVPLRIVRTTIDGNNSFAFQEHSAAPGGALENLVYPMLVNRLNVAGGPLKYTVTTTEPALTRGSFVDTQRQGGSNVVDLPLRNLDDYRTQATPLGTPMAFVSYYLGLS